MDIYIPKSENDVRLQTKPGSKNPAGLPVGVVRLRKKLNLQFKMK